MTGPGKSEPDLLAQLIAAEKELPDPPSDVERRVFSRLSASLALPPVPDVPTASGPAAPSPSPPVGTLGHTLARLSRRGVVTFLAGAAAGAATYGTVAHLRQASPEKAPAPMPIAAPAPQPEPAPTPTLPDLAPRPSPAPHAATTRASERETAPGAARDHGLAAERKLIEMARTALGRGQTDDALVTLRRHARSFPKGQLAEERESLLVQALVAKGDFREARQRAIRFREQYPTSLFGPVVDQAVRSIP